MEFFGSPWNGTIWDRLPDRVRSGTPATELAFGVSFFDYLNKENPAAGAAFNAAMAAGASLQGMMLAEAVDLSGAAHVCDVGGGNGAALAAVLRAHPHLRGTVFDLPVLQQDAEALLREVGVAARAGFVGGSFFEFVFEEADVYTLLAIIHDWDDERCVRMLERTRAAMRPGGRILVVEKPLPSDRDPDLVKATDMLMLVLGDGGRERTEAEYLRLFETAGLRLVRRTTLPSLFEVFELAAAC